MEGMIPIHQGGEECEGEARKREGGKENTTWRHEASLEHSQWLRHRVGIFLDRKPIGNHGTMGQLFRRELHLHTSSRLVSLMLSQPHVLVHLTWPAFFILLLHNRWNRSQVLCTVQTALLSLEVLREACVSLVMLDLEAETGCLSP